MASSELVRPSWKKGKIKAYQMHKEKFLFSKFFAPRHCFSKNSNLKNWKIYVKWRLILHFNCSFTLKKPFSSVHDYKKKGNLTYMYKRELNGNHSNFEDIFFFGLWYVTWCSAYKSWIQAKNDQPRITGSIKGAFFIPHSSREWRRGESREGWDIPSTSLWGSW